MAASDRGAPARSAVVVTVPPHLTDDGLEWFVYVGGRPSEGGRRPLRVGEHVAADHPLVLAYPGHFQPSAEPVDCWPQSVLTQEATRRQQAEQMHLASYPCRRITPCCARCGAQSEESVILHDAPTALQFNSALSALDDADPESWAERWRIENKFNAMAKATQEQEAELVRIEAEWRSQHATCPPGTPPLPEPGKAPEDVPLLYRAPGVRTI